MTGKRTHGMSRTPVYRSWTKMKERCSNHNDKNFKYYGGRGIKVCDRWIGSFENFLADMGDRPSIKHSIDRIDVNGDYSPDNCRWALMETQNRNRRKFKRRTIKEKLSNHRIPPSFANSVKIFV